LGTEFGFENPGSVEFTDEELTDLIAAIHLAQDTYEDVLMDLGKHENAHALNGAEMHEQDKDVLKVTQKRQDNLDVIRRKLGDKWEPSSEYTSPDDISGLGE
jgi:hypothetical protein